MIYGTGVDLVATPRISKLLQRHGDTFVQRILNEGELKAWQQQLKTLNTIEQQAPKLAKYWAAKEACSKAFGTGFAKGLGWRDIGLSYDTVGKPSLYFLATAKQWADEYHIIGNHISFSDEQDMVIAMVILETKNH